MNTFRCTLRPVAVFGRAAALAGAALLAIPSATAADTILTTEPGSGLVTSGNTSGVTFGQTFQTPNAVDTVLKLFRLSLRTENPGLFVARLTEWDPIAEHSIGPVLFASPVGVTPTAPDPVYLTFLPPGGVLLAPGTHYTFFVSIASAAGMPSAFISGNPYPDGGTWGMQSADLATIQSGAITFFGSADRSFTARSVPLAGLCPSPPACCSSRQDWRLSPPRADDEK